MIASVRAHPLVCGRPEFTDGWLPRPVREELGGGGDTAWPAAAPFQATRTATTVPGPAGVTPAAPGPAFPGPGTGSGGAGAWPDIPAPAPAPAPPSVPVAAPASAPGQGRGRPGRGRRLPLLPILLVTGTLLAAAGAVYYLDIPTGGAPSTGGSPVTGPAASASASVSAGATPGSLPPDPAAAYLPGYTKAELTAPDSAYEFDLKAGKVVPAETADWYLARDGRALAPSEESDSFVSDSGELTVAACLHGIETRPAAALPFTALAKARPFCVRGPDRSEIAIVRLVGAPADDSTTIVVDQDRRS